MCICIYIYIYTKALYKYIKNLQDGRRVRHQLLGRIHYYYHDYCCVIVISSSSSSSNSICMITVCYYSFLLLSPGRGRA